MQQDKDQLEDWAKKWEDAQKTDDFKPAPAAHIPSPQTYSDDSFFGPINSQPTELINECDARYWNALYALSKDSNTREVDVTNIFEAVDNKENIGDTAKAMADSPNPVYPNTTGTDQELTARSLGGTFTEKDILELAELKLKLHELQDKLNSSEGKGEAGNKFVTKIHAIAQQIDELSTGLTQEFPHGEVGKERE